MATWYRAWFNQIDPIEVDKETAKYVFSGLRRFAKDSNGGEFIRPTREEAKAMLVAYRQAQVDRARRELARVEERLLEAQNL